jgi:hypothetical protein
MTDKQMEDQSEITGAPLDSYSPEDQAFYKFWYGHMLNDLMQPPLCSVSHSTARYIWDAARRSQGREASEREEDEYVIKRLSTILAEIAIAFRGPELPRHRHGYHDLGQLAREKMLEIDLLRHQVEELKAAQWREAPEWMPIESAPKDGSQVLLFCNESDIPITGGYWYGKKQSWICGGYMRSQFPPTHWQPLPPLPIAADENQGGQNKTPEFNHERINEERSSAIDLPPAVGRTDRMEP